MSKQALCDVEIFTSTKSDKMFIFDKCKNSYKITHYSLSKSKASEFKFDIVSNVSTEKMFPYSLIQKKIREYKFLRAKINDLRIETYYHSNSELNQIQFHLIMDSHEKPCK
jgi:hypothetical protein